MSGKIFQYEPGAVSVSFRHGDFDYLDVSLRLRGDARLETSYDNGFKPEAAVRYAQDDVSLECFVSSAFCPFPDLIAWLEAITCGVQECAFVWEAEGPEGRLQWNGVCKGETGLFEVTWSLGDAKHGLILRRYQLVEAFYTAFRNFVESADYEPKRYERPEQFGSPLGAMRSTMIKNWLKFSLH